MLNELATESSLVNITQFLQGSSYPFLHLVIVLTDEHVEDALDFKPHCFVKLRILIYQLLWCLCGYWISDYRRNRPFSIIETCWRPPSDSVYSYSRYQITVNNNNHFRPQFELRRLHLLKVIGKFKS